MQAGMQLPQIDRINKLFIIVLVSAFIINEVFTKFMGSSLLPYLALSLDGLTSGKVWTLVTYTIIPSGLIETIFNALIVWFIGSELSQNWGEKRYLKFMVATVLGGAIIGLGTSTVIGPFALISGASAFCSALCVAYGVLNPERTMYFFFFPLQAKWFVAILVAMNLYNGIFSSAGGVLAWTQLGAMASGWAWMVYISKNRSKVTRRKKPTKSHLKIVKDESGDSDNDPTYH